MGDGLDSTLVKTWGGGWGGQVSNSRGICEQESFLKGETPPSLKSATLHSLPLPSEALAGFRAQGLELSGVAAVSKPQERTPSFFKQRRGRRENATFYTPGHGSSPTLRQTQPSVLARKKFRLSGLSSQTQQRVQRVHPENPEWLPHAACPQKSWLEGGGSCSIRFEMSS